MFGALSGGMGLSTANSVNFAQWSRAGDGLGSPNSSASGQRAYAGNRSSTAISGPGQLLSDLQQLQMQNPAEFQRVVSQISSQLQNAAHQAQGSQSDFLANLATQFQNIADGGSLSLLQPQGTQHHVAQAYTAASSTPPASLANLASANGRGSPGSSLQQLFSTISSEVNDALAD